MQNVCAWLWDIVSQVSLTSVYGCHKLKHRHLHVNHSTFHRACFLIPDDDGVYKQRWWNNATLLDTHTLLPWGITSSVLPQYFFYCGCTRLYCGTTYCHLWWTRGVSTRQRRGFAATWWVHTCVVSGGTVSSYKITRYSYILAFLN